jgi:suppressor of G2 allele of SKP1
MAEAFQQANSLFIDEQYDAALALYCSAIGAEPANADFYVKRAACLLKLDRFTGMPQQLHPTPLTTIGALILLLVALCVTEAIQDANDAIRLDPKNSAAYLRKGYVSPDIGTLGHWGIGALIVWCCSIACFSLEEYESAKMSFEQGLAIDPQNAQYKTWLRKCNAECMSHCHSLSLSLSITRI